MSHGNFNKRVIDDGIVNSMRIRNLYDMPKTSSLHHLLAVRRW